MVHENRLSVLRARIKNLQAWRTAPPPVLLGLSNFVSNENSEVLKRYAKGIQNIIDKDASFTKSKQSSLDDFFPTCV